jgi:hypothetical protein
METITIARVFEIITAIGTFSTGIAALIGLYKVTKNALYRNEVLYGKEAEYRLRAMEATLKRAKPLGEYPFVGGPTTIIPQLKIMRMRYNRSTMPLLYKGCTQIIRYISQNKKAETPTEKVWGL